ncbi:MAG: 50S ribosomal protein L6 [Pseudomonadota bacterium]|jgi:large subunit ribosomal protein L6|nr:50S ribosomal protein L6 [Alphaproteobacteria bacterium]
MSRVGKHEVVLPAGVTMAQEGSVVTLKGKTGAKDYEIPDCINFEKTEKGFLVSPKETTQRGRSLWGTTQRNLSNIVKGLDKGFSLNVSLVGVGYRASVSGSKLTLQLGYSHDIVYDIPKGIEIKCEKPTAILITGFDKQLVGTVGAHLRKYRKPEPYKGKGVLRETEFIIRKEGKKK